MDFEALVNRLEVEAERLRESIAVSHHRLLEIETFLKLGKKFTGHRHEAAPSLAELMAVVSAQSGTTQRDRVLTTAETLLADARRRTTRELLAELLELGVSPGGTDPVQTLSTYLSRDERFSSDVKRGGWTLSQLESRITVKMPDLFQFKASSAVIDDALALARAVIERKQAKE